VVGSARLDTLAFDQSLLKTSDSGRQLDGIVIDWTLSPKIPSSVVYFHPHTTALIEGIHDPMNRITDDLLELLRREEKLGYCCKI
jgi:hypothetical protein